jgi:hypothetical protein
MFLLLGCFGSSEEDTNPSSSSVTQDEASVEGKTYLNVTQGITLTVPEDWEVTKGFNLGQDLNLMAFGKSLTVSTANFVINSKGYDKELSIEDLILQQKDLLESDGYIIEDTDTITLDEVLCGKLSGSDNRAEPKKFWNIIIPHKELIEIAFAVEKGSYSEVEDKFSEIIQSIELE